MNKADRITFMVVLLAIVVLVFASAVTGQIGPEGLKACQRLAFSTEEDFVTFGPEPADGNPIISDGDLLGIGCVVCARNQDLLKDFDVNEDLGLDAVDVIDVERYLVAFSTELDSPHLGQFSAGDLLFTNGAIIPNAALLSSFNMSRPDMGLDAVHFVGEAGKIIQFVDNAQKMGVEYWRREGTLQAALRQFEVDIWFSTEGTGPYPAQPVFLDGDLLSARDGIIVVSNDLLLPAGVPAGIPSRGVDFGLDAVAADRTGDPKLIQFSTEILYEGELGFTDGDVLLLGDGIVHTNKELIECFEPRADFLGLDALAIVEVVRPPCGAAIIRVGGMPAGSINADGLASGPSATTPTFSAYDSPFGQWVEIIGLMPSCTECTEFRVEYGEWVTSTIPPISWTPLTDTFKEWIFIWPSTFLYISRVPDSAGWLDILCNTTMGGLYVPWNTSGRNGKYSLRLTVTDTGGVEHVSSPVVVMLDNKEPDIALTIFSSPQCGDVMVGDTVSGMITGTDVHFYSYRLRYESGLASGLIMPVRKYAGVTDTGDANVTFAWDTTGLPPCGYRIVLEVWDRTIRSNKRAWGEPGYGWRSLDQYYFCLETAGE
ncbi:hypothetical protein ACFLS0_05605 [Candidatus Bipolaricaulota bacterium]